MLKKKTVTDKKIRIKYACFSLVAYVIMPTSHNPKIVKARAELIRDTDHFFAYLWGRLAFDMIMRSFKSRDANGLSQSTLAMKDFVHALQLVMVEVALALIKVVQHDCSSSSKLEHEDEKDTDNGTD